MKNVTSFYCPLQTISPHRADLHHIITIQTQHSKEQLESCGIARPNKKKNTTCRRTIRSGSCTHEEQTQAKTIFHVVLALSNSVKKKQGNKIIVTTALLVFRTILLILWSSRSIKSIHQELFIIRWILQRVHNVFLYRKLEYLLVFAFQRGLIPCWNENTGSFSVALDHPCHAEFAICYSTKEERIRI